MVQREVEMLRAKQNGKRREKEAPEVFATRYQASFAHYVNQSSVSHHGDDKQWAIMLLRNATLTPDTLKSVTFQLITGSSGEPEKSALVTMETSAILELTATIISATDEADYVELRNTVGRLKESSQVLHATVNRSREDSTPTITLNKELAAVLQVKVDKTTYFKR